MSASASPILSITSILVSRFILNLQEVKQGRAAPQLATATTPTTQSSLNFRARIVGSLGSSVRFPGDASFEDEQFGFAPGDSSVSKESDQESDTAHSDGRVDV